MENNQKLHIALGAVIGLMVIIGLILVGTVIAEGSSEMTSNQLVVMSNSVPKTVQKTESICPRITNNKGPCEDLGQTLREQKTCYQGNTNCNNVEVNIHNSGYSSYNPYKNYYYKPYRVVHNPHNKYYNNYHPYYKHGFYYSDSHGIQKSYHYY
jgi:hypothetical protein